MATWKTIDSTIAKYTDEYNGGSWLSKRTSICLQYKEDSETPEKVTVRFKYYRNDGSSGNLSDSVYILYNANDSESSIGNLGRTLFKIKPFTGDDGGEAINWPYYSDEFTIKKNYKTEEFTLQDFWICNDGRNNTTKTASAFYSAYKEGAWRGDNLSCKYSSSTFAISGTAATDPLSNGTVSITDNGNNTFTISGTKGKSGTNNTSSGPYLTYGYDELANATNAVNSNVDITLAGTAATRKVYAKCVTKAEYGPGNTVSTSKEIKRYVKPNNPGKPEISYTKNRFTPKERIIYKWTAATKGNDNSPLVGYRVRLFQKKAGSTTWKNIPIWSTTTNEQKSELNGTSTTDWIYDRPNANVEDPLYISLGHEIHGFEVGDSVKLSIQAYSKNGAGTKLLSGAVESAETLIQNAGIVHIKAEGAWKEGQVYVKVNGTWKEAESVHVNVNGSWKESQ